MEYLSVAADSCHYRPRHTNPSCRRGWPQTLCPRMCLQSIPGKGNRIDGRYGDSGLSVIVRFKGSIIRSNLSRTSCPISGSHRGGPAKQSAFIFPFVFLRALRGFVPFIDSCFFMYFVDCVFSRSCPSWIATVSREKFKELIAHVGIELFCKLSS